jgi:hypothetical protein
MESGERELAGLVDRPFTGFLTELRESITRP